jgi:putative two-component system response regulator
MDQRILVVDDRQQNVLLTRRILGKGGYAKVRSATDSRAAMTLVHSWEPVLVILDLHMPHMGGTEFIERLRAGESHSDVQVLVLTADDDPEVHDRALGAGAARVLTKPIDAADLLAEVGLLMT